MFTVPASDDADIATAVSLSGSKSSKHVSDRRATASLGRRRNEPPCQRSTTETSLPASPVVSVTKPTDGRSLTSAWPASPAGQSTAQRRRRRPAETVIPSARLQCSVAAATSAVPADTRRKYHDDTAGRPSLVRPDRPSVGGGGRARGCGVGDRHGLRRRSAAAAAQGRRPARDELSATCYLRP